VNFLGLILLGLGAGLVGTLIGAGGGFILVPILVLTRPDIPADHIVAISMAMVLCNAVSGTITYAAQRRIDYRAGVLFALMAVPGSVLGAYTVASIDRRGFEVVFASFLMCVSVAMLLFGAPGRQGLSLPRPVPLAAALAPIPARERRRLTIGMGMSFAVGYIANLLGIGGGLIHVPLMVYLLRFPVHTATATSHFILLVTAIAGTAVHVSDGKLRGEELTVAALGIGAVIGAQIGARLARRIHGRWIIRVMALALAAVGLRILWAAG
jgi:uncharacterized membrane protein YfcA